MSRKKIKNEHSHTRSKNIVVIGGGTGSYTVLSGLKKYPVRLSAIVTMADDGGSTGRLRDEFGVLPPGDLRQCLVALSRGSDVLRTLFNHRFDKGELKGHNFGNLFISALEQTTGNMNDALDMAGHVLKIHGRVIPVTLNTITLVAELHNGNILRGESTIAACQRISEIGIKKIYLEPKVKANPKALKAIAEADLIVVGPGNIYCSLLPNFFVQGVRQALIQSRAKKLYVANLMNKHGHTDHFTVLDYVNTLESKLQKNIFDSILYNTKKPSPALLRKYRDEGEPVLFPTQTKKDERRFVGADLLARGVYKREKGDTLKRTLIRHDFDKLAKAIMSLI